MPERQPLDGRIEVRLDGDNHVCIVHTPLNAAGGLPDTLTLSNFNAWRVFGMLACMLHIPLTRAVSKAIKF